MVTQKQYLEKFKKITEQMLEITKVKNHDYSTKEEWWNAFKNFQIVETLWITSVEKWILVRMCDKVSRISNLIDWKGEVKDESILSTLIDLANYSIILKIYLEDKNGKYIEDPDFEKNIIAS